MHSLDLSNKILSILIKQMQTVVDVHSHLLLSLKCGGIGIWHWNITSDEVYWDQEMRHLFGVTGSNYPKTYQEFLEYVHPEDREQLWTNYQERWHNKGKIYNSEYRIIRADGSIHAVSESSSLHCNEQGQPERVVGVCWNISKRKFAESKLQEVTERLNLALEAAAVGTWRWYVSEDKLIWDVHARKLFALNPEVQSATYSDFLKRVHPDDRRRVTHEIIKAIKKTSVYESEYRIIWPDGSIRIIGTRGKVYRNCEGKVLHITGACSDLTDRHMAQEKLREVREKFRSIIETSNEWIWEIDSQGHITYSNPALTNILGYPFDEVINKTFSFYIHPDEVKIFNSNFTKGLEEKHGWTNLVTRRQHKDGSYIYLESSAVPVFSSSGMVIGFRGCDRDITERKKLQEKEHQHHLELERAGRISSVGEMISTLAHELNQPLAAINNYTKGSIRRLERANCQHADILQAMQNAALQAERAGSIMHRMKDFVRKRKLYYQLVNLTQVIHDAIAVVNYEKSEIGVKIIFPLGDTPTFLPIDKLLIEKVVLNLLRNSIEAMKGQHTIDPQIDINIGLESEKWLFVDIIDNGPGFSEEIASRLIEPYFTTKPHGMGMGLAICRNIVEAHGGRLQAKPNPTGGAWFQFTLPLNN